MNWFFDQFEGSVDRFARRLFALIVCVFVAGGLLTALLLYMTGVIK